MTDRGETLPPVGQIAEDLAPHGLFPRGVVVFAEGEAGPPLDDGQPARSVMLVGAIGGSLFGPFSRWRETVPDRGGEDPLDSWSKAVLSPLARRNGLSVYYPSDPPYQPFQGWAKRAEGLRASPLGILIHPVFGLWHSYRGALAFPMPIGTRPVSEAAHPCDRCVERPCLGICPVGAVRAGDFAVADCRCHLRTDAGQAGCMVSGCVARNACPVGAEFRYGAEQLRFHMAALRL